MRERISHSARKAAQASTAVICVLICTLLSGCGLSSEQRQAATAFGSSASAFGTLAGNQLTTMQSGSAALILAAYTTDPKQVWPGKNVNYDQLLLGKLTPKRIAVRQQAAKAISDYGQAISSLVSTDPTNNLQSAASSLDTSLKALPADLKVVSNADIDVLTKLIQQGGSILVDQMKADALRQIVPKFHLQIERLCSLLSQDFNPTGGASATYYLTLSSQLYRDVTQQLDKSGDAIEVRSRLLPTMQLANLHNNNLTALSQAAAAGKKCVSASQALTKALSETNYSLADIEAFAQDVENLYTTAKAWK